MKEETTEEPARETPEQIEARRQDQYANDGEWEAWQISMGRDPRVRKYVVG